MTTNDDSWKRQRTIRILVDTDDEDIATAVERVLDETYPVEVQRYDTTIFDGAVTDDEDYWDYDEWKEWLNKADSTVVLTDQPLDINDDGRNNAVRASKYIGDRAVPTQINHRIRMSVLSTAGAGETDDPLGVIRTAAIQSAALNLGIEAGYYNGGRCAANCETVTDLAESGEFLCKECKIRMKFTKSRPDYGSQDWPFSPPKPEGPYPLTSSVTLHICPDVSSVAVGAAVDELEDRFAITPTVIDADPLPDWAYDDERDQYELLTAFNAIPNGDGIQFQLTDKDLFHRSRNWVFGAGRCDDTAMLSTHRLRPIEPDDDRFTARVRKQITTMIGRCLERYCEEDCVLAHSATVAEVDQKPPTACEACRMWWAKYV